MAIMWKIVLTWQVSSAAQPMSGWAQFEVGHQVGLDFNPKLIIS